LTTTSPLGWNPQFQLEFSKNTSNLQPARIIAVDRDSYLVAFDANPDDPPLRVSLAGRLRHANTQPLAVGDWVGISETRIDYVCHRSSSFVRKRVGDSSAEQVIAANVDWTLAAVSLNDDFSPGRVERFVLAAWDAGTTPVVLLTKCDLANNTEDAIDALSAVAIGCTIIPTSVRTGEGIEEIRSIIGAGQTAVLVGSSGVGKSTLINALLGREVQVTSDIRGADAKGRHTTTRRELLRIPDTGGLIIDTPGMREFGVVGSEDGQGLEQSFRDIEELAMACGFRDCQHQSEPDCAVLDAVDDGELEQHRLDSYFKLLRELAYNERRQDAAQQRKQGRALSALIRQHTKHHHKR